MSNKARDQKPTRPNAHLEERLEAVKNGPGKLLKPKKAKTKAEPAQVEPEAVTAAETPPVAVPSRGYHPDAYGLEVADGSLGLHATPGAIVVVEPVMPTKAGLAVFYLKGQPIPAIFDLPRTFAPYMALPFAPESEVVPVVEAFAPETGALCHIRADRIEKVHRIIGVQTPVDSSTAWRPMPKRLPEFAQCPEGMGEYVVRDASMYPLIRPGETVIFDPSQRDPEKVVAFVFEWSNGTRSVLETNLRQRGAQGGARWWVDPVNRPVGDGALERRMGRGPRNSMLFASDGPFTEEALRERIVGRVVGILAPRSAPRPQDENADAALVTDMGPASSDGTDAPNGLAPNAADVFAGAVVSLARKAIGGSLTAIGLTSEVSEEICAAIEDHAQAIATGHADPDTSDAAFNRHVTREQETDAVLRTAPVQSLADLRAKLLYLVPLMSPDMLDKTHVAHLDAICADMDRLCRERSRPADNDEDAELLQLGEQLDRAHAHWRRMAWQNREPQKRYEAYIKDAKARGLSTHETYEGAWSLQGVRAANDAEDDAYNDLAGLSNRIWAIPHRTPAGLAVKARALIGDYFARCNYEQDAALGDDEDLHHQRVRWLIEACCTLAGVDWRGDPIAPSSPDPIFKAIKAHRTAWAACDGLDDGKDPEGYETAHDACTEALENVESTRPTTIAGLFALARYLDELLNREAGGQNVVEPSNTGHAFVSLINACLDLADSQQGTPPTTSEADPIFAAIKETRRLDATWQATFAEWPHDTTEPPELMDRRTAALSAMWAHWRGTALKTTPTTSAGCAALAGYVVEYFDRDQVDLDEDGHQVLRLIAQSPMAKLGPDRDWAEWEAHNPGFLAFPQRKPTSLLKLEYAIPQEAAHLLGLAEAELDRRRQAYVGHRDPTLWPSIAAELRRDLRMDALATVAAPFESKVPADPTGEDPIFAAIQAHNDARAAFAETVNAQDAAWVRERGGDTSDEAMAPAHAAYEAASEAETRAWAVLVEARPATLSGVLALARHAQQHAPGKEGLIAGPEVEEVFGAIADGIAGLLPQEPLRSGMTADHGWAIAQASTVDLTSLSVLELHNLFEAFVETADRWLALAHQPWADDAKSGEFRMPNGAGRIIDREQDRAGEIRTRIVDEIRTRKPLTDNERNWRLETLIRYELMCEASLRLAPELRAEITETWGD